LTHFVGNDAHQNWSPDGEFIVFAGSQKGFNGIQVVPMRPIMAGSARSTSTATRVACRFSAA
jgi:Tol biopolymer transport system component